MFATKQKQVETLMNKYQQDVRQCVHLFAEAVNHFLDSPDIDKLRQDYQKVHYVESQADDVRREVEELMYSRSLFPESRGDILGLIETMDKVPNQAEESLRILLNQHIKIPQQFSSDFRHLVGVVVRCVEIMLEASDKLFDNFIGSVTEVGKLDEIESQADSLEASIINKIFSSDLDGFEKILLRDLIQKIAGITDRSMNVGDRIRLIVAKRRV